MATNHNDDPQNWTALARFFHWVNRLGEQNKLTWALGAVCVVLVLLNFTFAGKGHFSAENFVGFYAIYGFIAFSFIIFASKALREIIKRDEDFYANKSIDREEYPQDGTERFDHHVD